MKDQTKPGGSATAVTEPQQNAAPPAAPAPATPAADPPAEQLSAAERKQLAAAERKRIREITALGKALGRDQLAAQLIEEEVDLGAATSRLLAEAAAAEDNRPPRLEPGRDATDKFRVAALNGIMLRSGQPVLAEDIHKSPQALSEASDLRGMSMVELARECIYRETGQRSYGSKMEAVGFAMTSTSDFPYLLSNVAHKSMLKGYAAKPGTWRQWCAIGSVPDFKQFTRVLVSEADDLVLNPEGAEYEESSLDEKRQRGQAYTYGRLFSVTRHALVNDDLDQLTKQPMRFGMSSERLISTLVYTLLMSGSSAMGPTLDDGSALFVDGTNWFDDGDVSGFNSTLDLTNGQAAINHAAQLLRKQYNLKGLEPIDVTPRFCLIPPEVEMYARILFGSVGNVTDDKNAGVINPWRGFVEPIVEARLSASSYTGYSATAWYLLGAPGEVDTCEVCFLDGQQSPRFEQEEGFRIDGVTFKVSTDAGVTWLDRKGVVKSKGAA